MAATREAPSDAYAEGHAPRTFSPSSGDSALLISPTLPRPAEALPEASVAAAAISTAPVRHWVSAAPNGRIPASNLEVTGPQLFVGDGGLLVEDHPRIEYRADHRRHQIHEFAIADRQVEHILAMVSRFGCAAQATAKKASSNEPMAIADRSTRR